MYSTIGEANLKVNNGSELGVESFLFKGGEGGVGWGSIGKGMHILKDSWG